MSTPANEIILRDVIMSKVNNGEAFTAFDITMQAKKMGMSNRHREVKETSHDIMYEYPNYITSLIDVPGVTTRPILYSPIDYNVDDYIPMDRDELFEPIGINIPATHPSQDDYDEIRDNGDWLDDEDDNSRPLW